MGAYHHCFEMMKKIGLKVEDFFESQPFDITIIGDEVLQLKASRNLTAPWHLFVGGLFAKGLSFSEKNAFYRLIKQLKRPSEDCPADIWLLSLGQTESLIERFWSPLCLGALTTPVSNASAFLLYEVLHQVFFTQARNSDWYFPTQTLDRIFPLPAVKWLATKGAHLHLKSRVSKILLKENKAIGVEIGGQSFHADYVILATAPRAAKKIFETSDLDSLALMIDQIKSEPISTLYLQFPPTATIGQPMLGFSDPILQWVFDRGITHGTPGLLAVVTSSFDAIGEIGTAEFSQAIVSRLTAYFPYLGSNQPITKWIRDRHGAISATPGCQEYRPRNRTYVPGLWLAGDYCHTPYPSTIEGAMMSGQQCIKSIKKMRNSVQQGVITLEI